MARTERTYYVLFALYCASWASLTPIYPLFLLSRGLDLFEINVVFAVYLIGSFVLEVPTGAVADVVGRKPSFVLSCLTRVAAFMMYFFADSFADCLLAEFVDALGTTLATGALDAWVVDGMRAEGDSRPPGRVFARAQLLANPVMIASGLAGAYVADVDMSWPWPIGAALFALTGVVALLAMREPPKARRHTGVMFRAWVRTTVEGFATVRRLPTLAMLCALTAASAFAVMPAWHYWPARLQALSGQGTWLIGWVWALISLAAMVGNWLMPRLVQRFAPERVVAVASMSRGAALGIAVLVPDFPPNLLAVLVLQAVYGLIEPTLQGWMNENVDSSVRATVLSVRSMAFTFGGGVGLLFIGLVARSGGIEAAWSVSAVLILLVAPGYLLLGRGARRAAAAVR